MEPANQTRADEEEEEKKDEENKAQRGGGGWGGWGFSAFSVLSDLQKAASVAAEEISRNAVAAAKNAAKGIADIQAGASGPESTEEEPKLETSSPSSDADAEEDDEPRRKSALDKLESASEDSLIGQGLKALDSSVESLASGAWNALGSAWKGGSELVQKLEHSAVNLADSIHHGGLPVKASSLAPSILETGKSFTTKGMEVLERVGKETMELLITETGIEVEKNHEVDQQDDEEQFEEVTFDRCFYIYGGPDHLEELEALSSHHALLFNRRKTKLLPEQKSLYDGQFKQIQQIFSLSTEIEDNGVDPNKGKNIDASGDDIGIEMKTLCDASFSKAADMAAGFIAALGGLAPSEITQRTSDRLESVHSEGVHRVSELCCFAVSQLLMLGKSAISNSNKLKDEESEDNLKIDLPEDSVLKAKFIRSKAQSMSGDVEAVSNSFITGISDIIEAYLSAMQNGASGIHDCLPQQKTIQEKASTISNHLRACQDTALDKIQDALQYLGYVIISTSMSTA